MFARSFFSRNIRIFETIQNYLKPKICTIMKFKVKILRKNLQKFLFEKRFFHFIEILEEYRKLLENFSMVTHSPICIVLKNFYFDYLNYI